MLDKLIKQVKAQTAFKKTGIFFLAFAATLTVMGGNHDIFYGSSSGLAPEKAQAVQNSVATQENEISSTPVYGGQMEQEFAAGMMFAAAKTPELEEASTTFSDKKHSPDEKDVAKAESKLEDEENADDEANADEDGTNKKTGKKKKAPDLELSGFVYSEKIPMSRELQEHTYKKCVEHGLEYELVLAIIWRESGFNVDAVHINANGTRDNGIMQINDVNRKWLNDNYGITDLMDPYQNIDAGTAMLGRLTSKYGAHNAMLAYQYGEGGMAIKLRQGVTTSAATEKAYAQRDHYRKII